MFKCKDTHGINLTIDARRPEGSSEVLLVFNRTSDYRIEKVVSLELQEARSLGHFLAAISSEGELRLDGPVPTQCDCGAPYIGHRGWGDDAYEYYYECHNDYVLNSRQVKKSERRWRWTGTCVCGPSGKWNRKEHRCEEATGETKK